MARLMKGLKRMEVPPFQPTEDLLLKPIPVGGFRGMDKKMPLPVMPPDMYRLCRDVNIRFNSWAARDGTSAVGTAAGSEILYACDVRLIDGSMYLVRFRVDGVDVFQGGAWVAATGTFSGNRQSPFAITGWNDRILFTAGAGGIYQLTFNPSFQVSEISGSPAGVIHLATFAGRVVASLYGTRVQWSVKFNHADWSGLGSGFEDLQSAAGGRPDQQCAVVPATDEIAYCIRSESIWQISVTGNFDQPLTFSRIMTHVGSILPTTVRAVKNGFVCVGQRGQVWHIAGGQVEDIAGGMTDDFDIQNVRLAEQMFAAYDVKFDEYRVVIPTTSTTSHRVLRYSFPNKAWTEDVYPFPIKSIAYTMIVTGMGIDDLTDTIDTLSAPTIDELGTPVRSEGFMYAMKDTRRFVVKDDPTVTDTATKDVQYDGTRVAAGFRLESGTVKVSDLMRRQEVVEIVAWYETNLGMTLTFEYSVDAGVSWVNIGSPNVAVTSGQARPVSVQKNFDRDFVQFAISTAAAPVSRLVGFFAMMREGARIVDAN